MSLYRGEALKIRSNILQTPPQVEHFTSFFSVLPMDMGTKWQVESTNNLIQEIQHVVVRPLQSCWLRCWGSLFQTCKQTSSIPSNRPPLLNKETSPKPDSTLPISPLSRDNFVQPQIVGVAHSTMDTSGGKQPLSFYNTHVDLVDVSLYPLP